MRRAVRRDAKQGAHARHDIVQNTAFGDAKNPEGLVKTWRTSSRAWRWRAVLCAFLSLLLLMMQPTGNALYRSWNAATGEAQGLGVAFATGEGEESGDLVPATFATSDISLTTQESTTLATADVSDHITADGRVYYWANYAQDAPEVTWATSSTTVSNYEHFENVTTSNLYLKQVAALQDELEQDEATGNLGAISYVGELSEANNVRTWSADEKPGLWAWALGYKLKYWAGITPNDYWTEVKGYTSGTPSDGETVYVYPSTSILYTVPEIGVSDNYEYVESPGQYGNTLYALGFDPATTGGKYDIYLFAIWEKRDNADGYTLKIVDDDSFWLGSSSGATALSWDEKINVSTFIQNGGKNSSSITSTLADRMIDDYTWAVCAVDGSSGGAIAPVAIIQDKSLLKQDTSFGKLINPNNEGTNEFDPYSKSSEYYADGDGALGTAALSPGFVLTYDANGGKGGTEQFFIGEFSYDAQSGWDDLYAYLVSGYDTIKGASTASGDATSFVTWRNHEFQGWALNANATEPDIAVDSMGTAEDPKTLYEVLKSVSGFSESDGVIYDASNDAVIEVYEGDYSIFQNITLYAVWEQTGSDLDHTVNYVLDSDDSGIKLSKSSDTLAAPNKISSLQENGPVLWDSSTDQEYSGAKYTGELTWATDASVGLDGSTPTEGDSQTYTVTLTPVLATYDITLQVDASTGAFANGVTEIIVEDVPYGTAYSDIKFDLTSATASGSTLTVAYDDTASNTLSGVASAGAGTLGTYSDTNGNKNTWTGTWSEDGSDISDLSAVSVSGATTLTYTYDEGYNEVVFKLGSATNATSDADDAVSASQSTSDLELSSTAAYVAYSSWTTAGIAAAAKPTAVLKDSVSDYELGDKYAVTSNTAALTWSGEYDDTATTYTYTAQPTLQTFAVTLTIAGTTGSTPIDSGGFIRKKWEGEPPSRTLADIPDDTSTTVVGKVAYGDYAKVVIDDDDGVVPSIDLVNDDGYTTTDATWEYKATSAADSTYVKDTASETAIKTRTIQVMQPLTFRLTAAVNTFPVTVEVNGGTFNQLTPSDTETTASFTITGVPYNTPVQDIKYNSSLAYDASGTYSLASPALTAGTGRNTSAYDASTTPNGAKWSSSSFSSAVASLASAEGATDGTNGDKYHDGTSYQGAGIMKSGVTLKYEFGRDDVTVNYKVVGGTWSSNSSDTITGTVPYGKTIADGTTVNSIPNPTTSGTVTVTDTNQYFDPSSTAGSWDTTPTSNTKITSTSDVTYTYTLATRNDLTVEYTIPTIYQNEVEFDGTASYNGITYGGVLNSVAAPPTAIKAKSDVDSDMVAKKYNLTGFSWNNTLAQYVQSNLTYVAQITLKDYSVTYSIVNGSWGSGVTSTDSATYHYGDKPNTSLAMATLATTGTHSAATDTVIPGSGYEKTGGAWEGVWEMRVSNDGKSTWTEWATISGTPSAQTITGDTQFRLTLKKVVTITFTSDTGSIASGFSDNNLSGQYYVGNALTAPTITDANLTAQTGYEKSSGSPAKLGYWDTTPPSTVPEADTTYTYALYPVYTATYNVEHGTWTSGGGAAAQTEEVFSNEALTFPDTTVSNSEIYDASPTWYVGTDTTGSATGTSGITIGANTSYLAYHAPKSGVTLQYQVRFWRQNASLGTELSSYDNYKTETVTGVTPGTVVQLAWDDSIITSNYPASAADITAGAFTADTSNSEVGNGHSATIESNDVIFDVYYTRNSFNLSYAYTYDNSDNAVYSVSGFPTPTATASMPYGATLSLSTAESTYATSVGYLTFDGWYDSADNTAAPSTMPARALALTGSWTRNAATIKLVNSDTASTVGNGTISATGYTANNIELTGYKYGDAITWPEVAKTPATTDTFFGGWIRASDNANVGDTLPTTVNALSMVYNASWSTGIRIQYVHDDAGAATFTEQDSGYLQPDTSGNVTIPAFAGGLDTTSTNAPNANNPAAKTGYVFQRWEWTEGGATQSSTNATTPKSGTTNVPLTFKAVYEGTTHSVAYDVNGGTQNTSNANAISPTATGVTKKTGDTIYLPSDTELTRTGCTLSGYVVTVGGAAVSGSPLAPGTNWQVEAGSASPYAGEVAITAQWTVPVVFATSASSEAGLSSTGIPAAVSEANTAYASTPLGTTVTLPAVGGTVISGVAVNPGYHFSGWTTNTGSGSTEISIGDGATSFAVPSASTDTFPSSGIAVTANWAIDQYTVHWTYDSANHGTHNDYAFTSETDSTINYGTTGSSVQASTAPTLKAGGTASTLNESKYTADANGIEWYLVVDNAQTKVKLTDITFGTPFYYNSEGLCEAGDSGATPFTWSSGTTQEVTFVGIPVIKKYTVIVAVTHGTMTNPNTGATEQANVAYTERPYGTAYNSFLPSSASDYAFSSGTGANIQYDPNAGVWDTDPFSGSLVVTGNVTYTYAFNTLKSYNVVYQLNDTENDDLSLSATPTSGHSENYGAAYSFPTLTAGTMDSTSFTAKYYTDLDWTLKSAVVDTTGTYSDDSVTGSESVYPKTVTFVGTPKKKSYTVRVTVEGGSFRDGVEGVTDNVKTMTTDAVYGKPLGTYLPEVAATFDRNTSGNMATGHWERVGARGTAIDPATDTVQYTDATYVYVFDTMRTVTFRVNTVGDGGFANNNPAAADGYYTKTYYVSDGKTLLDIADPADATGAKIFAGEAALQAMYKLTAQGNSQGYEWNTTGWTGGATTAANYQPDLTTEATGIAFPDASAAIGSDVTYTYDYAPKAVTVNFVQMFQDATGNGYSQVDTATAGTKHSATWTGSYSTDPVAISDWSGRLLDGTDTTLYGYKVVPVKATSDSAGNTTITEFTPTNFTSDDTYYLWYDRITVNYGYSYTNTAPSTADGGATPTSGSLRWGASAMLANPIDSTYAQSLNGWYTTSALSTLAAKPGESYTFKPAYAYSNPPESVSVTLYGGWQTASYPVTFANAGTSDPNDSTAQFELGGTRAASGASVTTSPVTYGTALGSANVPDVYVTSPDGTAWTKDKSDKYSFVGWQLYIGDSTSPEASVEGVTLNDKGYIEPNDLQNVVLRGPDYTFKPVFELNQITVSLVGGTHQTGLDGIADLTTWTVDYGTTIRLPKENEWMTYRSTEGASSLIDANANMLPFTEDQYAVRATAKLSNASAWVWDKDGTPTQWPSTKDDEDYYVLSATENAKYVYQWTDLLYEVHYMKVGGSTSNINALDGKKTTKTLTWGDSVFGAKLSDASGDSDSTVLAKFGAYESGSKSGVAKVLYPEWSGHTFLGWQQGTSAKAGKGTIVYPGNDITISAAYNETYSGNTGEIYLWALWQGETLDVTFHRNADEATETIATQALEIDVTTNLKAFNEMTGFARDGYTFNGWVKQANKDAAWSSVAAADRWVDKAAYTVQESASTDDRNLYANWTPNTYKVQFAYFDGTPMTVNDVTGAGSTTEPYQQEFTYDVAQNLYSGNGTITLTDLVNAYDATHNPGSDTFAGWSCNGTTLADGAEVSNLTTENNGVITLTPVAAKSVKLTYEANAGTDDTVSGMPSPLTASSLVIDDSSDAMNGYASFTLPTTEPTRTGYTFKGWKVPNAVDSSKQALSGNIAAGTTIYLSGTYAAYLAYAQWEAQVATTYTIERQVQSAPGSSTYTVKSTDTKNATSGTWIEIGAGDLATYDTSLEGYTYMPGLSTTGVYVAANGSSKIILKYNVEGYTVSYAFTEGGLALTGDAAGSTPFGTGSTVTVTSASPLVTLLLPNTATLPEGYQIVSGYDAKWDYASTQNSLKTADGASFIAASTVEANGSTQYKVVDDTTLTLPIEKKKFTVTFALGADALWSDGSSTGTVTKENVVYGTAVDPADAGATTKAKADEGYGFGGWKYTNASDDTDPLNGTIVDPATTAIKGDVTFTASYYESHTVTWSAGGHSASGFSNTPEKQRLFTALPPTYLWESDGTSTAVAGLQLEAADLDGANPKAEDGWTFDGWIVNGGTTKYASLDALYEAVSPNDDYTIEAQWTKITQTVLFDPNVSGGGKTGQIARALQGLSGESTLLDGTAATTPTAPDARAGYEFNSWQLGAGATAVQLAAGASFTFPMNPLGVTTTYVAQWDEAYIDIQSAVDPAGKGTIVANRSTTGIRALSTDIEYTLKANPQPGYKFAGWTVNTSTDISSWYRTDITDKTNSDYGLLTIQPVEGAYEEATYTAHFVADPYEVTFENSAMPGEGTISVTYASGSSELVNYNGSVSTTTVSVTPNTPGYRFLGWTYEVWPETADEDGVLHTATTPTSVTTPVLTEDLGTVPIIGRTVFTAKYAKNPATLTYDKHAAAATGSIGSVTGKETGDTVTLPSSGFTWAGHTLLGWLTADKDSTGVALPASMTEAEFNASSYKAGACGATYALKGGDETLYAVYKADTATLVYNNNATTVDGLAKASSKNVVINANEDATALTVAAVNWENGDTLATQPGYITDDASATRIPGAAREFVGWSFDANAVEGGSSTIFTAGETIPASYLPASGGDTATIYAIWKDKQFTVSLNANGGKLKDGATAPSTPLASGITYGDTVAIPELMYERTGHAFRYWLADDGKPTRVSDSSGSAATYKFIGTSDVTLSAQWYSTGTAEYKVSMQLMDEKGRSLTSTAMGPYTLFDTPLSDGAYEDLSVVSSSPLTTANTGDYFDFKGWYIYNTFTAAQLVGSDAVNPRNVEVSDIVKLYNGTTTGLPTYWNGTDYTDEFNSGTTASNLLTLYAKKELKAYDISFDPRIPDGSGYEATDVSPIADIEKAKVSGETRSLSDTYSLAGYTFLGWLKAQPSGNGTTTAEAWNASTDKVAADHALSTPLLSASSTDYQVTLYAAWADTDNAVTFVSAYPGDGVIAADAGTAETVWATQQHKTWKAALDAVTNPTAHAGNEYALFTGWYTASGVPITLGTGTGQCSTVADIVAADPTIAAGTDGSYDIKLYAQYSFKSARVVYNGDDDATEPTTLPVNQAVEIPETGSTLPAATITPHLASATLYKKAGFHMDGWEGKGNDGTYNNTDVAGGYYNKVWYDSDADRAINFDYAAAGTVVNLYPHFTANSYTVNYSYDVPSGYESYVMSAAVPGKDSGGNNVTSVTGLGLTTGSVYARNLFTTEPVLEGYELTGWTYTTPGNKTVTVEKGWTVDDLLKAVATADGTTYADAAALYENTAFDLKAVWTPRTYSLAYDADGGVLLSTGMAPGAKTDIAWDATLDSVGERLLIEASKLSKDGYSNPVWYANSGKTVMANTSAGGDTPTFGQLVSLWHQANSHASGTNIFDGTQPLTLYAGWTEDTVNVFFTVSDAENGWISSVAIDGGATTTYSANETTQLSYAVGAKTGKVTVGAIETTIDKVTVTAAAATGYDVSGWTFGADTVASTASYAVPKADRYVGGTYEALIEGDPNVGITLRYFDMDATGAYPASPTATSSGLTAKDFLNTDGGTAKVGDVIPAANLGAVRTDTPAGLSLDAGKLADYTVKASDNTVDVYFKRATVDVGFTWEWPDGEASATPPELPADYLSVYYQSTQSTPGAPTAPTGYTFDGWYKQGGDTALGSTFDVDSTENMTVVGKFSKASYTVTFTGMYREDGTTPLTGEGVPTIDPAAGISATVEYGATVGTSKKIVLTDTQGVVKDIALGMQTGAADLTVSYDSDLYAITWVYSKDGGTTWVATSDPTQVKIEGATEFRAVASGAQVVSYLAGEHGAFETSVAAGTRAENIVAPYDMVNYLYDEASSDGAKIAGPLDADGLPTAEAGWRFAGWAWEYTLPSGYPQTGSTPALDEGATAAQKMHAGVEDLAGLTHGITLTAQWEPAESYLKFDLNDAAVVYDDVVRASWASDYTSPEGLQPTYDPTANDGAGNAVTLPDADQVTRNGFTLKGWKWTVGSTTYELAPGASFQMPASDKTTSDDPAVTLTAKWEEDYVTINYYSNDNAKGTVSVSSETVGTWTGKVRGGTATLSGSKPTANEHFNFTKWTRDSLDGTVMTTATGLQSDNSLVPQRNTTDKRYDAASYYATFTGDMYYVTFIVDDASARMGTVTVSGFSAEQGQLVPYSDTPVMNGTDASGNTVSIVAKPNSASYDFADGRYWDYYTRANSSAAWVKKSSTTDPSTVAITAETQFRVNFKESTGTYPVHFDVRGGIGSFDDVYKAWGDANVGAGKTPRRYGYTFTGWYATPYGQTYASATDAAPGMLPAVSNTYGRLAGGDAYATKAAEEGITLLAGWSELGGFAVTLNGNGGGFGASGSAPTTSQVSNLKWTSSIASRVTSANEPERPGYEFSGWSTTPNGTKIADDATYASLAGDNDVAPGSVVLYALWTEKTYTVRYVNWPLSSTDSITADGALSFDRELKYTDVVATSEPYNSKSEERVWNAWQVIAGSSSEPNVALTGTNANWTIASLESNNVSGSGTADDPFMVYGTWTNYIEWTTTYVLYDDVYANPGLSDSQDKPGDAFADSRIPQYLVVTDKGLPGDDAVPNMVGHIPPGFELNEAMTVTYNNNVHGTSYATTSDMKEPLTTATVSGSINFDVVVVAKTGYTLAFDLNDDNTAFPGGYAHEAVSSADAGGSDYPTQLVKDFYKIHNVPWSVYATDNTDDGEALGDPTREGFSFDGWYNLVVKDNEDVDPSIDIKADEDMYYGDLAFDANGNWYDPMVTNQGVLTLYARWIELTRTVHYIVADDMKSLVKIRLQSEAESAYSTEERTEVIGAATGDVFIDGVREADVAQGAIAQANRGYSVVWRIVPADTAALSKTYEMPLGATSDGTLATASVAVAELSTQAAAVVETEVGGAASGTRGTPATSEAESDADAELLALILTTQGEIGGTDTATSSEGKVYQASDAITPAVEGGSDGSGLFVGAATDASDTTAMGVLYVATVTQNAPKNITFNPGDADVYSGPSRLSQPVGTYVGETAVDGVWGVADSGSLPDRNSIRRVGYVFDGWTSSTALTYVDENGNSVEIPAGTLIEPGTWMANHLLVPEGGIALTASWSEGTTMWTVVVPESTNPNTGEVVPATTIEVAEGETLTNDQIAEILNRDGAYPDTWDVSYYDVSGTKYSVKMTTDELIAFLQSSPVVSDMTIAPASGAKWTTEEPDIPDNTTDPTNPKDPRVRPAKSNAAKTGDSLVTMVPTIAGIALAATAVLFLLLSLRRRREE